MNLKETLQGIKNWCVNKFAAKSDVPTKVSQLTQDVSYVTSSTLSGIVAYYSYAEGVFSATYMDAYTVKYNGSNLSINDFLGTVLNSSFFSAAGNKTPYRARIEISVNKALYVTAVELLWRQKPDAWTFYGVFKLHTFFVANGTSFSMPDLISFSNSTDWPEYHEYVVTTDSNNTITNVRNLFYTYTYDSSTSTLNITNT